MNGKWGVRQAHTSEEVSEQRTRCAAAGGGDGAKGSGQGELEPTTQDPGSEPAGPGTNVGSSTTGGFAGKEAAVQSALAPRPRSETPAGGRPQPRTTSIYGSGRGHVAGLRKGSGGEPRGPIRSTATWSVPCEAGSPDIRAEGGRAFAPDWRARVGRQDRPTRNRRSPRCGLRNGLLGLFVRVSARPEPAQCAGRGHGWNQAAKSELDPRRRHTWLLDTIDHAWLMRFDEHRIRDRASEAKWLPSVRITHPYPEQCLCVLT